MITPSKTVKNGLRTEVIFSRPELRLKKGATAGPLFCRIT